MSPVTRLPISSDPLATFCKGIANVLVLLGRDQLALGAPAIERILPDVLRLVSIQASKKFKGGDLEGAIDLIRLIEQLAPDANSGEFVGFWAAFYRLQPYVILVPNLTSLDAELLPSRQQAESDMALLPDSFRELTNKAAHLISQAT